MTHTMRLAAAVRSQARARVLQGTQGRRPGVVAANLAHASATSATMRSGTPKSARNLAVTSPGAAARRRKRPATAGPRSKRPASAPRSRRRPSRRPGSAPRSRSSQRRRPASAVPALLERQVAAFKAELAQEGARTAAESAAATVPPNSVRARGFHSTVSRLKAEHASNVAELEGLFKERLESEARVAALEAVAAQRRRRGRGGRGRVAAAAAAASHDASSSAPAPGPLGSEALAADGEAEAAAADTVSSWQGDVAWAEAVRAVAASGSADQPAEEQRLSYVPTGVRSGGAGLSHTASDSAPQGGGGAAERKADTPAVRRLLSAAEEARRERRDALAAKARAGGSTIAARRAAAEAAAAAEAEEAARKYRFKAKPIPASTQLPLFQQIMRQQDTRRRLNHEARRSELQRSMAPFEGLETHEAAAHATKEARLSEARLERERQLRERARFRANPIPATVQGGGQAIIKAGMEEEAAQRKEAAARRAAELASAASLPPRMAMWAEAAAKRDLERAARARARGRAPEQLSGDVAGRSRRGFKYHNKVPDFKRLQSKFDSTLSAARRSKPLTEPAPFSFERRQRQEEEEAKRTARAAKREAQWEEWHGEYSLKLTGSASSSSLPGASVGAGGSRGESRRPVATSATPPPAMTRSVALRMAATQAKLREEQITEQQLAAEAEARALAAAQASAEVTPLVRQLEESRLGSRRLAWQLDDATPEAQARRAAWRADAKRRARSNAERVRKAQAARPPLLLRASAEAQRAAAGRTALLKVATALRKGGGDGSMHGVFTRGDMDGLAEVAYVGGHESAYAALRATSREEAAER